MTGAYRAPATGAMLLPASWLVFLAARPFVGSYSGPALITTPVLGPIVNFAAAYALECVILVQVFSPLVDAYIDRAIGRRDAGHFVIMVVILALSAYTYAVVTPWDAVRDARAVVEALWPDVVEDWWPFRERPRFSERLQMRLEAYHAGSFTIKGAFPPPSTPWQ